MRRMLIVVLSLTLWALTGRAQGTRSAEVQLKAALHKEQVEGDLKGAIELYKKIAQSGNRAVAAKALVHMGECYEKLGDAEARKAYERVVRDFGDQKEAVDLARAHLGTVQSVAPAHDGVAVRKVWTPGPGFAPEFSVSLDGRYLSYEDNSTGNAWELYVRDLFNGTTRRVTSFGSSWAANESVFSPDCRQIAYGPNNRTEVQLRVINVDGTNDRILYTIKFAEDGDRGYVGLSPWAWSPDRKRILATVRYVKKGIEQIAWFSVSDGAQRIVKTIQRQPGFFYDKGLDLSPDGKYIAYSRPRDLAYEGVKQEGGKQIFTTSADGSGDTPLSDPRWDERALGWAPDGGSLLFTSNRSGTHSAWLQPISDGKPVGNPVLVKRDIGGLYQYSVTRSGALYYTITDNSSELYTVPVDPATGKLVGRPSPLMPPSGRPSRQLRFSPDGRLLVHNSFQDSSSTPTVYIHDVGTGSDRELKIEPPYAYGPIGWLPDSRSLLLQAKSPKGQPALYRVDAESGRSELLKEFTPDAEPVLPLDSPDGKTIFYQRGPVRKEYPQGLAAIGRFDVATGEEQILYRPPQESHLTNGLELSPDGKWLAFRLANPGRMVSFFVMPASGGEPRKLYSTSWELAQVRGCFAWAADGRHLLFSGRSSPAEPYDLWRLSIDGGAPEKLETGRWVEMITASRDGRRIVFTSRATTGSSGRQEVWALENFTSVLKASK